MNTQITPNPSPATLPPLPLKNGCLEIDNSFLAGFTACPRKAQYSSLMRRIWAGERPALNFGSAIHRALEYRYTTLRNEAPTILDEQDIFDKALKPYFDANPQPEDDHRTLEFAREIIGMYNQRYAHEPFSLLTDKDGKVMAEMSFAVPLFTMGVWLTLAEIKHLGIVTPQNASHKIETNQPERWLCFIPIIYTGRIDLPVLWDGLVFIGDFKTAGQLGPSKADEFKVAPQFEGYCWSFEKLTGMKPGGFFIRGIRTKSKPGNAKAGWDKWWDECFMSHKEYLRPGQLDEWYKNTVALVEEFFWHYMRGYMPQRKLACTMYGKCPYYDVCYMPAGSRDQVLMSDMYTANEWSPLK